MGLLCVMNVVLVKESARAQVSSLSKRCLHWGS
jgi:hypothetical protein